MTHKETALVFLAGNSIVHNQFWPTREVAAVYLNGSED